ncbi:MAG TPA: DUF885 domain-containing protein [Phycisphaerae bacterium]|nr:DUF885 domain-containing protein [Phycisphaerae bacterium]
MLVALVLGLVACTLSAVSACVAPQSSARDAHPDESPQPAARPDSAQGGDLEQFVRRYETDRSAVSRFYDLPWSELRFDRLERVYRDELQRLQQVDFAALNQHGRIDYVLLRTQLDAELTGLARQRRRLAEMEKLLPFRAALLELEVARQRMEPVDPQAAAATLAAFADQIKTARERIERQEEKATTQPVATHETAAQQAANGPLPVCAATAQRAAAAVDALQGTLRTWHSFYEGYEPGFSWWVDEPYEEAHKAMEDYAKYLRENIAGLKGEDGDPLIGDPVGPEALADDLAAEFIPYTPEELIAIGERELAWCEAEMKQAAADMDLGDDWKAALAKVKDDHVPPGAQDDLVAAQARAAIRFLKERDLLTIPPLCEETWRVTMISPEGQKVLPFAAYGGQNIMIAYPTDAMKHADKLMSMRGNNRHFSRSVVTHELIPGHHMQAFMTQRHRPYRQTFGTPFFGEGWALYWEMTLWDLGYGQTPEDRIGMLFWRMHRAARIVVSLKFHLGQMTPEEMVDFLMERVGLERFGAVSEVRRYVGEGYSPLYQCAYMIGGLQLRALRRELVDTGKLTDREFHDALLTYGPIPIELIRATMLDLPLTPDTKPTWRFAGDPSGE